MFLVLLIVRVRNVSWSYLLHRIIPTSILLLKKLLLFPYCYTNQLYNILFDPLKCLCLFFPRSSILCNEPIMNVRL